MNSTCLTDPLAGESRAVVKARVLDRSGEPQYLTAPAASELLIGAYRLGSAYPERTKVLVDSLPLLPFDRPSYHEAGRLGSQMLPRGSPLSQADLFIAAITRRHSEQLLSRDRSFTRVPGLAIEPC